MFKSELGAKVFKDRYALKDKNAEVIEKTPLEMFTRIGNHIASLETDTKKQKKLAKNYIDIMSKWQFIPGGRILSAAGTDHPALFNCFALGIEDSIDGIYETLKRVANISRSGGGIGINFSSVRPRGALASTSRGRASGAVSFMDVFSASGEIIESGGSRRSAALAILNYDHPDIEEFLTAKSEQGRLENFNISVGVSREFLDAVEADAEIPLVFGGVEHKRVKAKYLWDMLIKNAHKHAEPGIFNLTAINEYNNLYYCETLDTANACSEQVLPVDDNGFGGVCCLGSLNMSELLNEEDLQRAVPLAVEFLDSVLDISDYIYSEIKTIATQSRRIGLGVMGLGDYLVKKKLAYNSQAGRDEVQRVMKQIKELSYRASIDLAKRKGEFSQLDRQKFIEGKFASQLPDAIKQDILKYGIRNSTLISGQPTGSTSILAGASSGIEPIFQFRYKRTDRIGEHIVTHPLYQEWLDNDPEADEDNLPTYFVTAHDVSPSDHFAMQKVYQEQCCSAVSKTCNLPSTATIDDVDKVYRNAIRANLKGITVYVDGCRTGVLSSLDDKPKVAPQAPIINTPEVAKGIRVKVKGSQGSGYVFVSTDPDTKQPIEIFSLANEDLQYPETADALCRIISLALRRGISRDVIVEQLAKAASGTIGSLPSRIEQALNIATEELTTEPCPECHLPMTLQSNCFSCLNCGFTKCQ